MKKILLLLLSAFFIVSCATTLSQKEISSSLGQESYNTEDLKPSLNSSLEAQELLNFSYGPHERHIFDFWKADAVGPRPLVIFIHGGGFNSGDKSALRQHERDFFLEAGVSVASINYRLMQHTTLDYILRDTARAVQYFRYRSDDLNIDKTRIACYGESAGAGASLWLAFMDDLADRENPDPVLRQSTRLITAGAIASQATYDFQKWPGILNIPRLVVRVGQKSFFRGFMDWHIDLMGMEFYQSRRTAEGRALRKFVDISAHISPDDPPIVLYNVSGVKKNRDILHHPNHHSYLARRLRRNRVECLNVDRKSSNRYSVQTVEFLLEKILLSE